MTTGSILIGLALVILVGLFVAQPLLMPEERRQRRSRSPRQTLLLQKEALLEEVRALDFDFDTGKIPAEVYEPQRAELVAAAAAVLAQLDNLGTTTAVSPAAPSPATGGAPEAIEQAIARRRQQAPADEIEQVIARRRSRPQTAVPTNGQTNFCPQCGRAVDPGDKFCVVCGHQLTVKPA